MPQLFDPTPDALAELERLADEIPEIQQILVENHEKLKRNDRGAHQQQIAGGKVTLTVADQLPSALDGLGLFKPGVTHAGIGRMSTGLGCPHIETDLDFLGIMLAFRTSTGQRVDFLGINDPTSPTDTVEEFVGLLQATADSAGAEAPLGDSGQLDIGNFLAAQAELVKSLRKRLGRWHGYGVAAHVARQTSRTGRSSTAFQQYWTGVVRATNTLGKFTLVPAADVNKHRGLRPGEKYLTDDWRKRQSESDLRFRLYWIPFQNEKDTPLEELTDKWDEDHWIQVGEVVFPQTDPNTKEAKLTALLAAEMGANPGNWVRDKSDGDPAQCPATRFTAGRQLVYKKSQTGRNALPEEAYGSFFSEGAIDDDLAAELIRRYNEKRDIGHDFFDVGEVD